MIIDKINDFIKENCEYNERIHVIVKDENAQVMSRITYGFTGHELLGCLLETQFDIMAQMRGESKPTIETFKTVLMRQEVKE